MFFFFSFGMLPWRGSTAFFARKKPGRLTLGRSPERWVQKLEALQIYPCIMSEGWGPHYNFCQFFSLRLGKATEFGILACFFSQHGSSHLCCYERKWWVWWKTLQGFYDVTSLKRVFWDVKTPGEVIFVWKFREYWIRRGVRWALWYGEVWWNQASA